VIRLFLRVRVLKTFVGSFAWIHVRCLPSQATYSFSFWLHVQVIDWDGDGVHDLIGSARVSINEILERSRIASRLPIHFKKKCSGEIEFSQTAMTEPKSFVDHLQAGLQLDFHVAIDFTLSNGIPDTPSSLHYRGSGDTPYEVAVKGVASILDFYNSDRHVLFSCHHKDKLWFVAVNTTSFT
jgi:hypothetical protein